MQSAAPTLADHVLAIRQLFTMPKDAEKPAPLDLVLRRIAAREANAEGQVLTDAEQELKLRKLVRFDAGAVNRCGGTTVQRTPLHWALLRNNVGAIKYLLSIPGIKTDIPEVDPKAHSPRGKTVLDYAELSADEEIKTRFLILALQQQDIRAAELMLAAGASYQREIDGKTALQWGSESPNIYLQKLMLTKAAQDATDALNLFLLPV